LSSETNISLGLTWISINLTWIPINLTWTDWIFQLINNDKFGELSDHIYKDPLSNHSLFSLSFSSIIFSYEKPLSDFIQNQFTTRKNLKIYQLQLTENTWSVKQKILIIEKSTSRSDFLISLMNSDIYLHYIYSLRLLFLYLMPFSDCFLSFHWWI
jgi:hypothetical protein